jgi:dolichyl-phosphate-mannose--protein O-mannosyl transferase
MPFARYGTTVVAIHAIVVALHGLAHQKIPVPLSFLQSLFVGTVIVLAPIVAVGLHWTPFARAGRWLFLVSMTGALLFGIYNHFIGITPDRISQIPFDGWGVLFQITAILLLVTEGLGCGVGVWALNTLQQKAL